tara:strand:+ start:130 stop:372 length:243 start_codon:yes stop_codon:yes gene_type:complete
MNPKDWYKHMWDGKGYPNDEEVHLDISYDIDIDDEGSYPTIYPIATYQDNNGIEQDYLLSEGQIERLYEEIYEAMRDEAY